jgi:transposase
MLPWETMKPLTVSDPLLIIGLQDEIRRNDEARYDHRLHAVLLVGQGMTCPEVAKRLGDGVRAVQHWVNKFEYQGFAGLSEKPRPGRPSQLTEARLDVLARVLRKRPADVGLTGNLWDGKTLSAFLRKEWGIVLRVRQCQRLFHKLGFRYRKPRHGIAHADPAEQKRFKKN